MRHLVITYGCLMLLGFVFSNPAAAHINPNLRKARTSETQLRFRENCNNAISQIDQAINNVRARLTTGGDVWWNNTDGRYVVPKVPPGQPEVSSLFAGAVWLGGLDPAGNLKMAAQTYGRATGDFDFWPGPLDPDNGTTDQDICAQWDRFFVVEGSSIEEHLRNFRLAQQQGVSYDPALIPRDVRGWPAKGNEFFFDVHGFNLPNTNQGLAGFWDQDGDGEYNPDQGDYPVIEIRGCTDEPQFPDQMTFWIYNDAGNIHAESQGDPLQMEVQVQAFAYATNDEINDMTFQRYKLINRAVESIDSTYFAMWVDPDLGCSTDDYVGCDTLRDLAFVYNEDALDGQTGCTCPNGVNTYCEEIPILGVDYFRGPLDEFGNEIGMSSFTYYNNGAVGGPPPGTTDPQTGIEYYRYISGSWRDGNPFTFGDDAYQDGEPINYAFTEAPDDPNGWSMCSEGLPFGDRRTIQASGPFRLDPGAVNELIIGVVWVADQSYPCPSIRRLQEADDIAQALFDNCFEITDGPDAPDIDFIELDQELIAIFTNDTLTSNNAFEAYAQRGLQIPPTEGDSLYRFEGYKLFQLAGPEVTIADLEDPDKARLIYQVDIQNGVGQIFNWQPVEGPGDEIFFVPESQVEGLDDGIRHTFQITEDQFAEGDRRLINHKKYYFTAVAYAYNNYAPFDPDEVIGQRTPYLEGRRNIGDGDNPFYTIIPRPITDRNLMAGYGDGAVITRIEGVGTGTNFLDLSSETVDAILDGSFNGEVTYQSGRGPVEVTVFNPLDVQDGLFELRIPDNQLNDDQLDSTAFWELYNLDDPSAPVIRSERSLEDLNEQIIKEYGFSVTIGQVEDVGENPNGNNGAIGGTIEYPEADPTPWLFGIADGDAFGASEFDQVVFDFVATEEGEPDFLIDPNQQLTNIGEGFFVPYYLSNFRTTSDAQGILPYITPAWTNTAGSSIIRTQSQLEDLNNVDIVFTPDKSKWSRCVVIETNNRFSQTQGYSAEGGHNHFDLRSSPNVTAFDNDGDGLPDIDTQDPGEGMGWFPGYAIDVETGERLNIFFGENSIYNGELIEGIENGGDMMFNPSAIPALLAPDLSRDLLSYVAGGQHFVYVTNTAYDECAIYREGFQPNTNPFNKVDPIKTIQWTGLILSVAAFNSYEEGLIPSEVRVKLRVQNPYEVQEGGENVINGHPVYRFRVEGKQASDLDVAGQNAALDAIRAVPNPYYAFSDYEVSQFSNTIKITNLPARATVTIYTLDGKFIRQYRRDETGAIPEGNNRAVDRQQIIPDLEWDLRNNKGIPVASGVYLIHVDAGEWGEKTIKWFGINRKFDPSGL